MGQGTELPGFRKGESLTGLCRYGKPESTNKD